MKKILSLLLVMGLVAVFSAFAFADDDFVITRDKARLDGRDKALIHTGLEVTDAVVCASLTQPVYIYRIYLTAIAATSGIGIYDAAGLGPSSVATCVFEIYEATDGAGSYIDFGDDPIKLTSGFTIVLLDAYAVVHYRGQAQD